MYQPRKGALMSGLLLAAACGCLHAAKAPPRFSDWRVVPTPNGMNRIDLDGDGHADVVINARRENSNAHGFDHLSFYLTSSVAADDAPGRAGQVAWSLVPFFDKRGDRERAALDTIEGADCLLRDVAVIAPPHAPHAAVSVVVAERDMGDSFADSRPVTFSVYRIAHNEADDIGFPGIYFQLTDQFRSQHAYCDVHDALTSELGITLPPGPAQD